MARVGGKWRQLYLNNNKKGENIYLRGYSSRLAKELKILGEGPGSKKTIQRVSLKI